MNRDYLTLNYLRKQQSGQNAPTNSNDQITLHYLRNQLHTQEQQRQQQANAALIQQNPQLLLSQSRALGDVQLAPDGVSVSFPDYGTVPFKAPPLEDPRTRYVSSGLTESKQQEIEKNPFFQTLRQEQQQRDIQSAEKYAKDFAAMSSEQLQKKINEASETIESMSPNDISVSTLLRQRDLQIAITLGQKELAAREAAEWFAPIADPEFRETASALPAYDPVTGIGAIVSAIGRQPDLDDMTDDEKLLLNYWAQQEKGGEFFEWYNENVLVPRKNQKILEDARAIAGEHDNGVEKAGLAIRGGLSEAGAGFSNLVNAIAGNPTITSKYGTANRISITETDSWMGQQLLGVITSLSNMAPAIGISAITSGLGAPATVAQIAGSATMGLSVMGNAYHEAKLEGFSDAESWLYAGLTGASETGMQFLLGGIEKLGSNIMGKKISGEVSRALKGVIRNPAGRNALNKISQAIEKTGLGEMAGEAFEEYLQTVLTPVYRNIAFGEKNEIEFLSAEGLESAFVGALTAGTVNAPRVMYNIATDGGLGLNRTIEDNAYHGLPKDTEALLDKKGEGDIIEGENKDVEKHQNGQKEVYEGTIKSHKVAPDTLTSVQWKTHDYILNKEHSTGKSKALWFERALGISRKNAEILNRQLIFDANKVVKTAETEYGIKYNQITTILGANGRKIDVVVVWIKNNDGVVRLVTIIPTKK